MVASSIILLSSSSTAWSMHEPRIPKESEREDVLRVLDAAEVRHDAKVDGWAALSWLPLVRIVAKPRKNSTAAAGNPPRDYFHNLQGTAGHTPRPLPFCTKSGRPQSQLSQARREAARRNGQSAAPASRASLEAGQTLPDGVLHEVGDLVQVQLVHDVAAVLLYGLAAETEHLGDVLIGVALGDELKDLALASREPAGGSARSGVVYALQVVVQHRLEGDGLEHLAAADDGAHGGDQLVGGHRLEQIAGGPGLHQPQHAVLTVVASQGEDLELRIAP